MKTAAGTRLPVLLAACGAALCAAAWIAKPGADVRARTDGYLERACKLVPECRERFRYDAARASLPDGAGQPPLRTFFAACGAVEENAGETTLRDGVPVTQRTIRLRSAETGAASAAISGAERAGYRPVSITVDSTPRAGRADVTVEFLQFTK